MSNINLQVEDPGLVLPEGSLIYLPEPPAIVTNPKIIPGFEGVVQLDGIGEDPQQNQPYEEENTKKGAGLIPSLQDIQFWLAGKSDALPPAPSLEATPSGCDVSLMIDSATFADSTGSDNGQVVKEEGFFIYRSQNGGKYQRIATWPAITEPSTWKYQTGYQLTSQYGVVTYTISAFNHNGENMSPPVVVNFSKLNCKGSGSNERMNGSIRMEEGELILPYTMDLAYLYLSVDGSSSIRVPDGHRMFQPESGVKLNIFDYLSEKMPTFIAADFTLSMEVWGWSGGELKFVGTFEDTVHRSVLLVCSQEGEGTCSNGQGTWITEINFSDQKPLNEQIYEFKWLAPGYSETDEVCIQAAAAPYPNDEFWNMGFKPIYSGCYYWDGKEYVHGSEGIFTENMEALLYSPTPAEDIGWGAGSEVFNFESNWFASEYPPDKAFTIFFRVIPHLDDKSFQVPFSNTVALHHETDPLPSELPPLASPFSSTFSVEILTDTYVPPTFVVEAKWGCVIVEEDPTNTFVVGQEICPPPFGTIAKMNSTGCEGNWDVWCTLKGVYKTFTESWDAIAYWYGYTKYAWASMLAETIPYCGGNEKCIGVIKKVIDEVIKEGTGLPENLPKSDELISKNVAKLVVNSAIEAEKYYTEEEYSVIEAGCALAKCEERLAKAIQQEIQHKRSAEAQLACTDSYDAYFHNKDAVCLDPSIIVHAAPGGSNKAGAVVVKITRKTDIKSVGVQQTDADKYRLHVTMIGENGILTGELFPSSQIEIPWMAPGEETYIAVEFPIIGGYINEPLYFGGISHMKAIEACFSPESSVNWVPCMDGGADSWDFRNPADKLSSEIGQP